MSKGLTKKELKRFKKAELLKLGKDAGMDINKKMSKVEIVNKVFKNKGLRKSLTAPAKRKMSEKQMANLARFRKGSDFKNESKIKPKAQFIAEIAKIEDVQPQLKFKANESINSSVKLGMGTTDKSINTQVNKIKAQARENKKKDNIEKREHEKSTNKTSDTLDQAIRGKLSKKNDKRLKMSEGKAKSRKDKRFGEMDIGAPLPGTLAGIIETMKNHKGNIKDMVKTLLLNNPGDPLLLILAGLSDVWNSEEWKRQVAAAPVAAAAASAVLGSSVLSTSGTLMMEAVRTLTQLNDQYFSDSGITGRSFGERVANAAISEFGIATLTNTNDITDFNRRVKEFAANNPKYFTRAMRSESDAMKIVKYIVDTRKLPASSPLSVFSSAASSSAASPLKPGATITPGTPTASAGTTTPPIPSASSGGIFAGLFGGGGGAS